MLTAAIAVLLRVWDDLARFFGRLWNLSVGHLTALAVLAAVVALALAAAKAVRARR
jgi:hypothetical protein